MPRRLDDAARDNCIAMLPAYQMRTLSIRTMAKQLGVSRSYLHRLLQGEAQADVMKNASPRRRAEGWEPLPVGSAISIGAIGMRPRSASVKMQGSVFAHRLGLAA